MARNTGKGKDRMGSTKDGLRLRWRYPMQWELSMCPESDRRRLPTDCCFAEKKGTQGMWRYEARETFEYEARVELDGETVAVRDELGSRLDAQKAAESLMADFCKTALKEGI